MRRFWWLFGLVAALSGTYHALMSGFLADRQIGLTLKHGQRQPSLEAQYADLWRLDQAINKHERRTLTLRSLTPHANDEGIFEAREVVRQWLYYVEPLLRQPEEAPRYREAFESTADFFRNWSPPPMTCLTPKAEAISSAIFWVFFVLAALSGLVRLFAGPAE